MSVRDASPQPPAHREQGEDRHRLTAPSGPWQWVLHNQRGIVLDRAIRQGTENVVICRLRFRLTHLAPDEQPAR